MPLAVSFPVSAAADWTRPDPAGTVKSIFRSLDLAGFMAIAGPAAKTAGEVIVLISTLAGISGLLVGLSWW